MTAANTALYIDNGRFGSKSVNGGTLWGGKDADGSDHPYYWPKTGVLAFAGYSPYDALDTDASAGEPKAESVDYDIDAANGGAAPKLTITGFSQGSYTNTSSNSVLSADNKTVDVMWFDADDQTALNLGNLVAIPQDLDAVSAGTTAAAKNAATVEILYQQLTAAAGTVPNIETKTLTITGSNSSDVQGSTTSGDWLYGRHYTYTITFGLEEILIDPSVDNWEAGTGTAE